MKLFTEKISDNDVVWCYENLLHRAPESDRVIAEKKKLRSFRQLVEEIVKSPEFKARNIQNSRIPNSEPSSAVVEDDVIWCYNNLLSRPPESPKVIEEKLRCGSFKKIVQDIVGSSEFRLQRDLPREFGRVAFEIAHGRPPAPNEAIEHYLLPELVKVMRRLIAGSQRVSDQASGLFDDNRPGLETTHVETIEATKQLLIFQTCDHEKYVPLIQLTSLTVLEYVKRWHLDYEIFFGIKRGAHPWHATFNRIYRLDELIKSGYRGWVLYLDADAYISDFEFDMVAYLRDKGDYALIASRISHDTDAPYWDINIGVLFANLGNPVCRDIVNRWKHHYDILYSHEDYTKATQWNMVVNDQTSLHSILKFPGNEGAIYSQGTWQLFNSQDAKVIRQILRADHSGNDDSNFDARLRRLKTEIDATLSRARQPL